MFFLVVYCIQGSALAQQNETEVLQTKVEKLQQKVAQLENRVSQLEKVLLSNKNASPISRRSINSEKWKNKQNWRKLERGMSKEQVEEILGEPQQIIVSSSVLSLFSEKWEYGSGDVSFSDAEVTGWIEPSFKNTYGELNVDNPKNTKLTFELNWEGDIARSPMVQPLPDNTTASEATITIRFEVKPDGTMGRIISLKKINPELEREVMRTLRSWRFSRLPSGVPQQSQWGTITFRFVRE